MDNEVNQLDVLNRAGVMNEYDETPYQGTPIPASHPWRLLWTSMVFGGPRPDLSRARILEVGCGDGANLLAIAACESNWIVHGIDASRRGIAAATLAAERSALRNVTFVCQDLATVILEENAWDIVIAHGIYSWIDSEHRASLRKLVRRALAPNGLAYISFNALPGWSVRGRVRDLFVRAREKNVNPREILQRLESHIGDDAWGRLLAQELRRAQDAREYYFVHEYCSRHNDAFWLGDFVDEVARDGLRWIGDSQFDLPDGSPYEQTRVAIGVPGIRGEELADLIGYRQFRCAVLARDDEPARSPLDDSAIVDAAIVSGWFKPMAEPMELVHSREQIMQSEEGLEIQVGEPLCKAALLELTRIYPDGLSFVDLVRSARNHLREAGCTEISAVAERGLSEGILRLWRIGALQLRPDQTRLLSANGC